MDLTRLDEGIDLMQQLIVKNGESIKLARQMITMFMLAKLEPKVVGGKYSCWWSTPASTFFPWKGVTLTIKHHEGETEVSILDVPRELWPEDTRRTYERRKQLGAAAKVSASLTSK